MAAAAGDPDWMRLFRQRADAKDVASAWLEGLDAATRQEAKDDAPTARTRLRRAIVDSEYPEVRADAADGWKYTATVLRAADEVLGCALKPRRPCYQDSGSLPFRPKLVLKGTGESGSLGLWWSDFDTASQAKRLREDCGVTHRLNVGAEVVSKFSVDDDALLKTVHVPMLDSFNPDEDLNEEWPSQFKESLEILRRWRAEGVVANVNCQMGKNRSGAVILLWLCCECGWDVDAAVLHLRSITALACGNPHLMAAMTQLLGVEVKVPLNPAADGGGWVCISPPGSPRAGGAEAFDGGFDVGGLEEASSRLSSLEAEAGGKGVGKGQGYNATDLQEGVLDAARRRQPEEPEREESEEAAGMEALFSELSDVD